MPTHRQCPHCVRQFTRTEHLARHIRSHTKEKPFNCVVCGKAYVREDTLIRHAKSHGTEGLRRASKASADLRESNSAQGLPISPSESSPGGEIYTSSSYSAPTEVEIAQDIGEQNAYAPSTSEMAVFGMVGASQADISISSTTGGLRRQCMDLGGNQNRPWDFWNTPFVDDFSTWPMNSTFSMEALDTAPVSTLMHDIPMPDHGPSTNFLIEEQSPSEFNLPPPVIDLTTVWFTKLPGSDGQLPNSPPSPAATTPNDQRSDATVDDQYRLRLSKVFLTPPPQDNRLPSSDFMNLCVRMYFARFNPLFPIIHSATFRPTAENGLLLLSITSVGCLFLGSTAAVRRGKLIFERVNEAVISSRENILARKNNETLAMVQASMIGQTFALLSGDPGYLSTFETFHGSVISFARREKMFDAPEAIPHISNLAEPELESAWRVWARREEIKRVCAGLRIHDGEMSALLHYEPLLRSVASKPPLLSSDRIFSASSALEWASIVQNETSLGNTQYSGHARQHRVESFSEYVILEGYGTSIAEDRLHGRLDDAAINSYQEALMQWYTIHGQDENDEDPGQLCLIMLWHWVYMSLLVDFDQLEQAIGRDGPEAAKTAIDYVSTWILSPNSTRCVLHALIPQRKCQSLRFDKVHALHVPRTLFCAAVAWYCYLQYGPTESAAILFENLHSHFPEMGILNPSSQKHISEITRLTWRHGEMSAVKAMTLCEIGESLQRISHWGIAREFARIVARLIYNDELEVTGNC